MDAFTFIAYGFVAAYYGALALICWCIWRRAKKRKWGGSICLSLVLLFLVVFPGLTWGILPGSSVYQDLIRTRGLTGKSFLLGEVKLSEHSERFFNGDGSSIVVYSISDKAASWLTAPSPRFFERFPARPGYRSGWETTRWRKTPSQPMDKVFIQFVGIDTETKHYDLNNPRHVAARLLTEEGNFYSYFYYMHGDYPGNVDVFIISPKERLLVIANLNT